MEEEEGKGARVAPSDSSCCVQPLECPYLVRARRKAAAMVVTKLMSCFEMIIMTCLITLAGESSIILLLFMVWEAPRL